MERKFMKTHTNNLGLALLLITALFSCGKNRDKQVPLNSTNIAHAPSYSTHLSFNGVKADHTTESFLRPGLPTFDSETFTTRGEALSASDKRYLKIIQKRNKLLIQNNHLTFKKGLREIVIKGKEVVIDDSDLQGILSILSSSADIKNVNFQVETLKVEKELHVPGANIKINAKHLILGDHGSIDITPQAFAYDPKPEQPGSNGLNAGTLEINTLNPPLIMGDSGQPRFILNGGAGQNGGPAVPGAPGKIATPWEGSLMNDQYKGRIIYFVREGWNSRDQSPSFNVIYKAKTMPTDGGDAKNGGQPGVGGMGGKLLSNWSINNNLIEISGGKSGNPAKDVSGGQPGSPNPYYDVRARLGKEMQIRRGDLKAGKISHSPSADSAYGTIGKIESNHERKWATDGYFEMSLKYIKDLHKSNRFDQASAMADQLAATCAQKDQIDASAYLAIRYCSQGQKSQQLITDRLDYYGNPAGWTPNLSLEANYKIFQIETRRSFDLLYMIQWLLSDQRSLSQKINAIRLNQDKLLEEIKSSGDRFNNLNIEVPKITGKINVIKEKEHHFKENLEVVREQLLAQAQRIVDTRERAKRKNFFQKAFKTLAVIAKAVPVGQPVFGSIATTVDSLIQGIGSDKPFAEFLNVIPDQIANFKPSVIQQAGDDWNKQRQKIDYSVIKGLFNERPTKRRSKKQINSDKKKYLENLFNFSKPVTKALYKHIQTSEKMKILRSEIQKELKKLEAANPLFKKLTREVEALNAERVELLAQINNINKKLTAITVSINENFTFVAKLGEEEVNINEGYDAGLSDVLQELKERAESRLDKYNYYLRKSYEYRLLEEYPGTLNLSIINDKIKELTKTVKDGVLPENEFNSLKSIYQEQLSKVVKKVIERLNDGRIYYRQTQRAFKLSQDQVKALNEGKAIYFNLMSGTGSLLDYPDVRINTIEVEGLDFEVSGEIPSKYAEGRLKIGYEGTSYMKLGDRYIGFHFGGNAAKKRLQWSATKSLLPGGGNHLRQDIPSLAQNSLLKAILSDMGGNIDDDLLLFARPGGLSNLKIQLKVASDTRTKIKLKDAFFNITFDYREY